MQISTKLFKSALCLLLAFTLVFGLAACGGKDDETTTEPTTESTTEEPKPKFTGNRLTGLDDLSEDANGKRPVAVMINNIKAALPQYGISDADIMFEIVVEGGITRMMAIYGDQTKIPEVCSVRSCRYYFPIFAHGFDAVYFCFGSNETIATPTLKRIGIDYIDGNQISDSTVFSRDPERQKKYSSEHTAYLKGQNMAEILKKYDIRTDYLDETDETAFNFRTDGKITKGNTDCDKVTLNFSDKYYSTFTYDAETKTYKKQHSGSAHMDQRSGEQLSYTNVFVLETEVTTYQGGPLMQVNWKGGTGYYISNGKSQKITWKKKSEDSKIVVYNEKGKQLKVNTGKSYIGVISHDSTTITAATK